MPRAWVPRPTTQDLTLQRYNIRVPPDHQAESAKPHRHAVYASEATGLLLIALLLLGITLIRYWHYIHWSWR